MCHPNAPVTSPVERMPSGTSGGGSACDVLIEFTYHAPPAQRGRKATDKDGVKRWVFPSDYEQRAAAATGHLQGR
jgi:hypothetical protein